jgi:hypothetical protein
LSELRVSIDGNQLRVLLRLLLDSAARIHTPTQVRGVVEILSMVQFLMEKLASSALGRGDSDSILSAGDQVPFNYNDCAIFAVQRLCSLKFQVDAILAEAPSESAALDEDTSVAQSQMVVYASQAILRVAQAIADHTHMYALIPSEAFRLPIGTTVAPEVLANIRDPSGEKFEGSFAEWQLIQLQKLVDTKFGQCRKVPITQASANFTGYGPRDGPSTFLLALPVSVDEMAQILPKVMAIFLPTFLFLPMMFMLCFVLSQFNR